MRWLTIVLAGLVVATVVLSVVIVRRVHRPDRRWRDVAQSRLLGGVPWGSIVVIAFVLGVYLFVQDGIADVSDPVTIPYRAWSYFSPLGMATASFSHASLGHMTGNLISAAVVAPIAEFAWGHYPDGRAGDREAVQNRDRETGQAQSQNQNPSQNRDRDAGRLHSWRTTPWIRALVIFPLVVIAIGLGTSLFALGPVIGFSGVVFAFAAFAIVHYPIVTLVGTLGIQGALLTLYEAVQTPIGIYTASPSPPTAPSWAGVAIQGHALGFFVGLVLGILLLERRGKRVNPLHLWLAVLLFALSSGLWQIYWFGGGNTYILLQGPGVAIVAALALVITLAVTASDRPVVPRRLDRLLTRLSPRHSTPSSTDRPPELDRAVELAGADSGTDPDSNSGPDDDTESKPGVEIGESASGRPESGTDTTGNDFLTTRLERTLDIATGNRSGRSDRSDRSDRFSTLTRRGASFVAVLLVLAVLAGMAIPVNLVHLGDDGTESSAAAVEIEGYTIEYDEDAENELVSGIGIDAVVDDSGLAGSGVIVSNDRHNIWMEAVTKQHLEATGSENVTVGGPGWRETVHVERTGWEPVGNDSVYQVWLGDGTAGGDSVSETDSELAHESDESRAEVLIDDRTVTVGSDDGEFVLTVDETETEAAETTAVPPENESTEAGGITFEREDETIHAISDGTEVAVASEESYPY